MELRGGGGSCCLPPGAARIYRIPRALHRVGRPRKDPGPPAPDIFKVLCVCPCQDVIDTAVCRYTNTKGYSLPIRPIYMRDGLDPPLLTNTHSHPRIHRPTQPNARQNCAANPYDQIEHGNDCPGELPRCVAWAAARCDANSECHSFAIRTNGVDCPTSTANASSHYMLMRLGTKSTVPNHQWLAFTKPGPPGPFPPGPPPAPGPRPHPMPPGPAPSGVPVESDCAIRRLALECECGTAADHNPHPIAARHSGASVALWAGIAS